MKYEINDYGLLISQEDSRNTKKIKDAVKAMFDKGYVIKQRKDENGDLVTMVCAKNRTSDNWKVKAEKYKKDEGDQNE